MLTKKGGNCDKTVIVLHVKVNVIKFEIYLGKIFRRILFLAFIRDADICKLNKKIV